MTTANPDIDNLEAAPQLLTLSTGQEIEIERLRTRQLFRLLKILTRGAAPILGELNLTADQTGEAFGQQLIAAMFISVPEAEDEAIDFISSMVRPADLIVPERSKDDKQKNEEAWGELVASFENPEIEDTFLVISEVIKREAPHIQSLGKQLMALLPSTVKPVTSSKKSSKG